MNLFNRKPAVVPTRRYAGRDIAVAAGGDLYVGTDHEGGTCTFCRERVEGHQDARIYVDRGDPNWAVDENGASIAHQVCVNTRIALWA